MAVIKNSVIGQFSGKLGGLAARIVRGRTILSQRPTSFRVNNSPVMVEIRQKFAVTISFVTSMLTLSALHEIWDKVKDVSMSVYNYGVRKNFPLSSAEKPTLDNMLTPKDGFPLTITSAAVAADAVTAEIAPLNTVMVHDFAEREVKANLLLCFYNPVNIEDAPYAIVPVKADNQMFDDVNPVVLNVPLDVTQQRTAAKYQNSILYLALTTHDVDGKVVQYSSTYSQEN